jgi:hypothetical protein
VAHRHPDNFHDTRFLGWVGVGASAGALAERSSSVENSGTAAAGAAVPEFTPDDRSEPLGRGHPLLHQGVLVTPSPPPYFNP